MLKIAIIDDEEHCRKALQSLVQDYCENTSVTGTADSLVSGYELICSTSPDMVLLDILLPEGSGFQLLEQFTSIPFQVVFTTAYHEYAIRAIKVSALDYLLKPVNRGELIAAVHKMTQRIVHKPPGEDVTTSRILVYSDKQHVFVELDEVIRIEAKGRKTLFFLRQKGKPLEALKSISEYEQMLRNQGFFQTHRCHVINMKAIHKYMPDHKGGFIIATDNKPVPLALTRKAEFELLLKG